MIKHTSTILLILCLTSSALAEPSFVTHNKTLPFGQSVKEVKKHLKSSCSQLVVHKNQALDVPTATESQLQIDCTNYSPLQHTGRSEWVFADDELEIVWVHTPRSHLEVVKNALKGKGIEAEYSLPGMADFYLDRGFGIRYEPSEFLYYSDRLTPYYRAWLASQ